MPGLYRQTTENIGTYRPLQKPVYKTHYIVPSTHCATKKIIPAHSQLVPYELPKKCIENGPVDVIKNSTSLPRIKNYTVYDSSRENLYNNPDMSSSSPLRFEHSSARPYTPPEKRYSANFGMRVPERKHNANKQRPRSSYVYENIHAQNDFCINNECNMGKVKNDKNINNATNVKVKNFPTPAFSSMYIQENLE